MTSNATSPVPSSAAQRQLRWLRAKRLTTRLLLAWFACTFGIIFFARELSRISFFGWPLSFYLAAQGSVILYTIIVGVYAFKMRALDRRTASRDDHVE